MAASDRIKSISSKLADLEVDQLLITNLTNVRYLTGFSGTNGQVLVNADSALFFTDPRYEARAGSLVTGAEIVIYKDRLTEVLPTHLHGERLGIEATTMTVAEHERLARELESTDLVDTQDAVEVLRRRKDDSEIAAIREAVRFADEAFDGIGEIVRAGRTEAEIALDLEIRMRRSGADGISFDPIVGSGPLSSHIHHSPSGRVLEEGDLVLLDYGARAAGYCSDLTRTVVLGEPTTKQKEVYSLVAAAQQAGIDAIAAGRTGAAVDAAAREVISAASSSGLFGHGLGHGVGLDIHEAPRLHPSSDSTLQERDCVTVEPGVYEPGWGGIRIEDCVIVTASGAEVLGKAPKQDLIFL